MLLDRFALLGRIVGAGACLQLGASLAVALGSALLAALVLGLVFVMFPKVEHAMDPYLTVLNAMPRLALAPLFLLWFGLGIASKVALGVTLVFFIVFFNVYQGVKEVSPVVLANARMLGMNERQLLRHVYVPSALSWMFSSLHTSVGFAVVGAVVVAQKSHKVYRLRRRQRGVRVHKHPNIHTYDHRHCILMTH
jgi:ABC-type nitrate/sulfonate/bicarbonate transport system permease component